MEIEKGAIVQVEFEGILAGEAVDTYRVQFRLPDGYYVDCFVPKNSIVVKYGNFKEE